MRIQCWENRVFKCYYLEIWSSNELKKDENYRQLNHFNQFEKSIKFCKICKLLSTIYQKLFENYSIFDEVDEKKSTFCVKQNVF